MAECYIFFKMTFFIAHRYSTTGIFFIYKSNLNLVAAFFKQKSLYFRKLDNAWKVNFTINTNVKGCKNER